MAFAARVALLCTFVFCSAAPVRAQSPAALLEQLRSIDGGLYNMHVVSTSLHAAGGTQIFTETDESGLRSTLRDCAGAVCIGTYFDGTRLYQFNMNGTLLPAKQTVAADLRAQRILLSLQFLDPAFAAQGGAVRDAGAETFDGKRCRRISVSEPGATAQYVYIDPNRSLVAGGTATDGAWTIAFHDYRRVAAFQLPFEIDYDGAGAVQYSSRTVVSEPFDPPAGLTPHILGDGPGRMPLDPTSVSPLGTCTIGGITARCLIDTGDSGLSMSRQLAQKLRAKPIGILPVSGLGSYSTEVVQAGPLQLGNVEFGDANYAVLEDAERYGYDLVIGADVLATMPVTIDYEHHVVLFDQDDPPSQFDMLPMSFDKFVPVVNVKLNGLDARLAIDTGDESSINLAYNYYERHPDLFSITSTEQVGGVGGQSVEDLGEISAIRLGGITAQNQPIGTTRTLQGTADGHLGAEFLSKFNIVLDYPRAALYLSPL